MPEAHTCTCGGQTWTMSDATITCVRCGKLYGLMWLDDEMESSDDFNERIKKEATTFNCPRCGRACDSNNKILAGNGVVCSECFYD